MLCIFLCAGCASKEIYKVTDVLSSHIKSELHNSQLDKDDQEFILKNISPTINSYISVKMYKAGSKAVLEIDEFNYSEWTNSQTGEKGRSPYGKVSKYRKTKNGWEGTGICRYQG